MTPFAHRVEGMQRGEARRKEHFCNHSRILTLCIHAADDDRSVSSSGGEDETAALCLAASATLTLPTSPPASHLFLLFFFCFSCHCSSVAWHLE